MKESLEVIFLNELDVNIFDEYFYKNLLNGIVNLLQKKLTKRKNEIMTCACLEQAKLKIGILACACHRQVEDNSFGRRSVNENSF